jgi:hypothetical protein
LGEILITTAVCAANIAAPFHGETLMAVVVIPASEGLAALAAAVVAALGACELVEAEGATPRAKERDCADTPDDTECKQCRLGTGMLGQASQPRFINANNLINYRYQLYIANLYAAPERFVFTRFRDETNEEVNMVWERLNRVALYARRPVA